MSSKLAILSFLATAAFAADTSGCGKDHHHGYNDNNGNGFVVQSQGKSRTYTINIPSSYEPNNATGVIISYHGRGGSSAGQYKLTNFDNESWNPSYITVFPQGVTYDGKSAWTGPSYADPTVDDRVFTKDLLAHLRQNYCVDSSRIYASGKSNGAGFVGTLACSEEGGEFAAFSACSAALYTDNEYNHTDCKPSRANIPMLEFHGSADDTIYYNGRQDSAGGITPPIPEWLNWWGERDGCSSGAGVNTFPDKYGGKVNHTQYSCSGNQNEVQGYWIQGMGHSWPSTSSNSDNRAHGDGPTVLDATPLIVDFYNKYTLPSN